MIIHLIKELAVMKQINQAKLSSDLLLIWIPLN